MSEHTRAHEAVLEAVRQGESRLRRHALIVELSRAAIAAAAAPAVVAALRVLRPVPTSLLIASFVIPAVALAAWAVFRIGRHAAAERTARRMDRDAALQDELVSAHWFASHGPDTDWTHAQIDRAAARVNAIDWDAAQPAPRPKTAWAAAAVLLGVTAILLFVPAGTIGGSARLDAAASAAAKKKAAAVEMLETRIDATEMSDADRMRAKDILAALEKGGLSSEEAKKLLAELEALLGKDGLDKATLEAMAKALDASPSAKDLAEALRNRDMARAAKEARKLSEKAQSLSKKERDALAKAMDKAASEPKDKSLEKLADDLRDAAEKLRGDDAEEMKKSLEKMADSMDKMAKEAQEKGAESTESMEEAMSEAEQGEASDQGEKAGESKKQSSQSTGNMQGEGEGMAREAASMPNPSQSQMPGLGQMSGQPQGQPPQKPAELKEGQRRIEVALKEELVRAHDEAGNDKPEELVDRKTERVDSTVQYRRVEGAPDYDRTKAQQEGTIPEARRAVVKKYFSALGPRGGGKQ